MQGLAAVNTIPWIFDPVLIGTLLTAAVAYWLLAGPLRTRVPDSAKPSRLQVALFASGLVVTFLAEASPLHDLSERYLFSAHMAQHLLLSYVVAPLLIAGTPVWMVRPLARHEIFGPLLYTITRPVVAFTAFTLGFSLWHLPMVYGPALVNPFIHHFQHVIFLILALMVWWPVMSRVPELPRAGYGTQIIYLAALPLGQLFVGAILTFAQQPFYPTYSEAARIAPISVLGDQQLGGVIMKIASFVAFGIPVIVLFLRWFADDNRAGKRTLEGRQSGDVAHQGAGGSSGS